MAHRLLIVDIDADLRENARLLGGKRGKLREEVYRRIFIPSTAVTLRTANTLQAAVKSKYLPPLNPVAQLNQPVGKTIRAIHGTDAIHGGPPADIMS